MSDSAAQDGFFKVGGTLDSDAPSYVLRPADEDLLALTLSGEYCNVLAARQMGKSSLMVRTAARLEQRGVQTEIVDLSTVGTSITPHQWYLGLVRLISQGMRLSVNEIAWWGMQESTPVQRFTRFMQDHVLATRRGCTVIFIDEIDSTLTLPFTDDFFAAIRALYNQRASNPDYRRLTFVLMGVARPADLIKDRMKTPYNIGRTVDLDDFSAKDSEALLPGLARVYPTKSDAILERVLYWTGGHPYLTQRVCAEVVALNDTKWSEKRIDEIVEHLFFREGQLRREANLQRVDDYIRGSEYRGAMLRVYREVLSGKPVADEERSVEKSQLKLSGLVKATPAGYLQVRNRIYNHVFGPDWAREHGPRTQNSISSDQEPNPLVRLMLFLKKLSRPGRTHR